MISEKVWKILKNEFIQNSAAKGNRGPTNILTSNIATTLQTTLNLMNSARKEGQ